MIILDIHIWLWWINSNAAMLGANRKELIETADTVAISAKRFFEKLFLQQKIGFYLSFNSENSGFIKGALSGS